MKPGKLDLPTIWRGCDWGPIILKWKDKNGEPVDISAWQAVAQSLKINLNPSITDGFGGVTQLSLTKADTANLRLGVEGWDWIWQQPDRPYRYPPFLAGKVEIKEPLSGTNGSAPPPIINPPDPPDSIAATEILDNRFHANWVAAFHAAGYRLDVATDAAFTSFVTGYRNLDVRNVLTYQVTGLNPTTTYHYRLRTYNNGGTSQNSNVIHVTTLAPPPPPNDDFADNIPCGGLAGSINGTTVGATRETAEPAGENSVWYRWRSPSSPVVSAWRLNGGVNRISVYKGNSYGELVLIANSVGTPPALTFVTNPDVSFYRIRVYKNTGTAPFTLTWAYTI